MMQLLLVHYYLLNLQWFITPGHTQIPQQIFNSIQNVLQNLCIINNFIILLNVFFWVIYTTVCEKCNTKKDTCDRKEIFTTDQVHDSTQTIRITKLYVICDVRFQYGVKPLYAAVRASKNHNTESKGPGYIPGKSPSIQIVCEFIKHQE